MLFYNLDNIIVFISFYFDKFLFINIDPFQENERCVRVSNALGTPCVISLEAHVKSIQGVIRTSERVTS